MRERGYSEDDHRKFQNSTICYSDNDKGNPPNEEPDNDKWEPANEFPTTEQTRNKTTEAAETLRAEINELDASITKLTEYVSELPKAVADLDAGVAEV